MVPDVLRHFLWRKAEWCPQRVGGRCGSSLSVDFSLSEAAGSLGREVEARLVNFMFLHLRGNSLTNQTRKWHVARNSEAAGRLTVPLFNFLAGFGVVFFFLAGLCKRRKTGPASYRGKHQERAAPQTDAEWQSPLVTQSLQAMFYGDLITRNLLLRGKAQPPPDTLLSDCASAGELIMADV